MFSWLSTVVILSPWRLSFDVRENHRRLFATLVGHYTPTHLASANVMPMAFSTYRTRQYEAARAVYFETISAFTEPEASRLSSSAPCSVLGRKTHQRSSALSTLYYLVVWMDEERVRPTRSQQEIMVRWQKGISQREFERRTNVRRACDLGLICPATHSSS